jgi:hypothetical protein
MDGDKMTDRYPMRKQLEAKFRESNFSAIQCREADLEAGDPHGTLAIGYQLEALTTILELILFQMRRGESQ